MSQDEITTLEDLTAILDSEVDYCEEMGISIEDANI